VEGTDSRTAFNVGAFGRIKLAHLVTLQPEILYTMKGAKEKFMDEFGDTWKATYKLTYLEIPLLFSLDIPVQGVSFAPALFAGPALGIKLSSKAKLENDVSQEVDWEDVKSMEFGLILGAGMGIGPVVFDFRYNIGLSSIDDSADEFDIKNRIISINAGYKF
jgi:hypothetical protein